MEQRERPKRNRRWLLWTAAGLCAALLIFRLGFGIYYREFYSLSAREFTIPGLNENFVPQGLEACGDGNYLVSGYISTTGAARLYYVSRGGSVRMIRVRREGGGTLKSHSGGICTNGPFTYLAGGNGNCYVLSSADLFDPTSHSADVRGVLRTDNAASFCYLADGHLLVGEYEYGRFRTAASHHITTPAGDRNTAVILAYPLDGDQPFGVVSTPDGAYSIPPRAQGMCFTDDGRLVLSASSFRNSSQLFLYDFAAVQKSRQGIFWTGGTPVPLYHLDSGVCVGTIPLPPYSEETVFEKGRLFILFESASSRFRFGRLVGGQYVYSMRLPEWEGDA